MPCDKMLKRNNITTLLVDIGDDTNLLLRMLVVHEKYVFRDPTNVGEMVHRLVVQQIWVNVRADKFRYLQESTCINYIEKVVKSPIPWKK